MKYGKKKNPFCLKSSHKCQFSEIEMRLLMTVFVLQAHILRLVLDDLFYCFKHKYNLRKQILNSYPIVWSKPML